MLQSEGDDDVRALHRTRVASRRLREVLPLLELDGELTSKLGRRLRKVTERSGTVRELDVLLLVIDELRRAGRYPDAALTRVAASVLEQRGRARARLMAKAPVDELGRLARKLEKIARVLEAQDAAARGRRNQPRSLEWAIDARIARRASTVSAALSAAGALYLPDRLHAGRIAVKKLRYAMEMSADIAHLKSTPDLEQLVHVQDILGRLHDLQVLVDHVRKVQASLTRPDVVAWRELDRLVVSIEDDCRRLHGRYMHERDALASLCTRLSGRGPEVRSQKAKVRS